MKRTSRPKFSRLACLFFICFFTHESFAPVAIDLARPERSTRRPFIEVGSSVQVLVTPDPERGPEPACDDNYVRPEHIQLFEMIILAGLPHADLTELHLADVCPGWMRIPGQIYHILEPDPFRLVSVPFTLHRFSTASGGNIPPTELYLTVHDLLMFFGSRLDPTWAISGALQYYGYLSNN